MKTLKASLSKWINAEQIVNSFNKEAQIASGYKFISPCLIMSTKRICPSLQSGKSIEKNRKRKANEKRISLKEAEREREEKLNSHQARHILFCSASNRQDSTESKLKLCSFFHTA